MAYTGRFAPSPTGPLHLGSLAAAMGSYLEACRHGGRWLLRMEDLDPPREMPGAADGILRTLEKLGFQWDGEVVYQSRRREAYAAAVDRLVSQGDVFPCACTRSEIADSGLAGLEGPVYPGTCRKGHPSGKEGRSLRLKVPDRVIVFEDGLQGDIRQNLARDVGDFIVRRTDGCHAYQLAVVVDDGWQGVTHVVRGADLLLSTPRQLHLQACLGLPHPSYMHLPVAVNKAGEKLSKQTGALAVDGLDPAEALWRTLRFLGQLPPLELRQASMEALWEWATAHWRIEPLKGRPSLEIE
ncbi:MAG: tRNA glutamyl-Q(34) synthetase GluQRS [Bacillota bacterium]